MEYTIHINHTACSIAVWYSKINIIVEIAYYLLTFFIKKKKKKNVKNHYSKCEMKVKNEKMQIETKDELQV